MESKLLLEERTGLLFETLLSCLPTLILHPVGCSKLLERLLTLGVMLSRSGCNSSGGSLRALLLLEEMRGQPFRPSDVDSIKAERSLPRGVRHKDGSKAGQIFDDLRDGVSTGDRDKDAETSDGNVALLMMCLRRGQ